MISGQITNVQFALVTVTITDKKGNRLHKVPDGATIHFRSSDEAVVGVEPQPDGLSCKFTSNDIGVATIGYDVSGLTKSDGTPVVGEEGTLEVIDAAADSVTSTLLVSDE